MSPQYQALIALRAARAALADDRLAVAQSKIALLHAIRALKAAMPEPAISMFHRKQI